MVDIDPAALSRPAASASTPTLANKTISSSSTGIKFPKTSQIIPTRIDIEPLYTGLREAIGPEQWPIYKETLSQFFMGRLNQAELDDKIGPILASFNGEREHIHNTLIAAIYGNVTREMPDQGPAPWVSANDKPVASASAKPVTGDAAERRLKGDVMQLPAKDRRRIKDLMGNDHDAHENASGYFTEGIKRPLGSADAPQSAPAGIQNMNFDLEIKKRFAQPLGVESGEFPDVSQIGARMLPFCYESGLANGHVSDAPNLMSVAAEIYIKEVLTQIFSRTRSNAPGESGSAGFGVGTSWIQTQKYKRQLSREEEAILRDEVTRDKTGLLPVESKAASERGPLDIADLRLSLELGDAGMFQFPMVSTQVVYGYRDGELENWSDYTWIPGFKPSQADAAVVATVATEVDDQVVVGSHHRAVNGEVKEVLTNGYSDAMDVDGDIFWDGAEDDDMDMLDGMLDSCVAVGS